jgi:hypothetical protein
MNRDRPANGSQSKRRNQAENMTGSPSRPRTGHRLRRNALRFSALRLLMMVSPFGARYWGKPAELPVRIFYLNVNSR